MRLKIFLLVVVLLLGVLSWPPGAWAQFTQVSGTITDPSGLPYANGTITPSLVISGSPRFKSSGFGYAPPNQPVGLDGKGQFVMQLADVVNGIIPAGGTWSFHVCSAAGTVQPGSPITSGPVCYDVIGVVISGSSQNISAVLSAAAPRLTPAGIGGGVSSINGVGGAFTFSGSGVSCAATACTFSGVGAGTTGQFGVFNASGSVVGSTSLSDTGTILSFTEPITFPSGTVTANSAGLGGFGMIANNVPAASTNGTVYKAVQQPSQVNGTPFANNLSVTNFTGVAPATCNASITPPANSRCLVAVGGGPNTGAVGYAIVGDGVTTDCLTGLATFVPCVLSANGTNYAATLPLSVGTINFPASGTPFGIITSNGTTTPPATIGGTSQLFFSSSGGLQLSQTGTVFRNIFALTVNGLTLSGAGSGNNDLNDTTPVAPTNGLNIKWQTAGGKISGSAVGDGNAAHFLNGTGTYTSPVQTGFCNGAVNTSTSCTLAIAFTNIPVCTASPNGGIAASSTVTNFTVTANTTLVTINYTPASVAGFSIICSGT